MFEQPDTTLQPVNIHQQIAELKRERALRVGVYSKMVGSGNLKQSVAAYQMHCLDSALRSLEYLRDNREVILAAVAAAKARTGDAA